MTKSVRILIFVLVAAAAAAVVALRAHGRKEQTKAATAPQSATAEKGLPKLVEIGGLWCIPCQLMAPIMDSIKKEQEGRLEVVFVPVEQNPTPPLPYGVRVIPTQIFVDASGKELWRHEGFISKDDIIAKWKEFGVDLSSANISSTGD